MNRRYVWEKVFAGLAMLAFAIPSNPKQAVSVPRSSFTSSDGTFQFSYPPGFQVCTGDEIEKCISSYIPACDLDAIVCVAYPAKEFEETSFGAATFEVRVVRRERGTMTADACVTPYPEKSSAGVSEWPEYEISAKQPAKMIGGILFVHGVKGDAAMSHWSSVDLYRNFHGGRCYELSVTQTGTNAKVFDPPKKELTSQQEKKVEMSMREILQSFRFVK